MNIPTLKAIIEAIENTHLTPLFEKAFGKRKAKTMLYGNKKNAYCSDDTRYAIMFNVETDELFFLNYATTQNNWASVAESQNPWVIAGYISANDIVNDNADYILIDSLKYNISMMEAQEAQLKMYDESIYV